VGKAVAMLLEAIDEQDCGACSYGFRPGRSPHHALHEGRQGLRKNGMGSVLDCDISAFFDNVQHNTLGTILRKRPQDGRVLELIERGLHAGILDGKEMGLPDTGSPPGAVLSPL
jgi:retron-type reverse transcriptase